MMLPWSVKPLWAPFIDLFRTKRQWILATQLLMALLFAGMAALIVRESLSAVLIGFFFLLAFASATHDVAVDGFYLIALDKHTQALLAGIRGTFYRIASVSVQGGLVMLAGLIEKHGGSLRSGWAYSLLLAAGAMLVLFLWHCLVLPRPADDRAGRRRRPVPDRFSVPVRQLLPHEGNRVDSALFALLPSGGGAAR